MLNFRTTSVATAIVVFFTSFTPSQAFQVPVPMTKPAVATENVVPVQYREWDRRRHWDGRHMRRPPPHRDGFYNGHRGYRDRRPGYRYHNGYWFPAAAFLAGALATGAIVDANRNRASAGNSHVEWCYNRYRSYRASDNTFQPNSGPRRQCVSPY